MRQLEFVIQDALGIHARSAGDMAAAAKKFTSLITIKKEDIEADLKNPLAIMRLAARQEERVIITAAGEDENQAIEQLIELAESIGLSPSR